MVGGVALALVAADAAGRHTGFDRCAEDAEIGRGLADQNAASGVADVGAVEAEANATHHLPHVVLSEIGIGTTRTTGATIEALVDAAQRGVAIEAGRLRMRPKDLMESHVSPFVRAAAG